MLERSLGVVLILCAALGAGCSESSFSGGSGMQSGGAPNASPVDAAHHTVPAPAPTPAPASVTPAATSTGAATSLDPSSATSCKSTLSTTGYYDAQRHLFYYLLPEQLPECAGLQKCNQLGFGADARFPQANEEASDDLLACEADLGDIWLDAPPPNDSGTYCNGTADGGPLNLYNFGPAYDYDPNLPSPVLCVYEK